MRRKIILRHDLPSKFNIIDAIRCNIFVLSGIDVHHTHDRKLEDFKILYCGKKYRKMNKGRKFFFSQYFFLQKI